jgi:hypothetical protein
LRAILRASRTLSWAAAPPASAPRFDNVLLMVFPLSLLVMGSNRKTGNPDKVFLLCKGCLEILRRGSDLGGAGLGIRRV